ncbi:hypothetical protein AVEN_103505-1 [Araneus ventricosus]|uniref:Secreted protein n=1 Tax=Araneus ventricosus TaxID=182803 RepID=A0A4Y2P7Y4_ARAVE|nr:hypothetical protein AVEN_103505-1 [Araneus ventricosus]
MLRVFPLQIFFFCFYALSSEPTSFDHLHTDVTGRPSITSIVRPSQIVLQQLQSFHWLTDRSVRSQRYLV